MGKKEGLVSEWLKKADHDFLAIETLMEHSPELGDIICFHCQQAAEKYLKGFLTEFDVVFKKSHSLDYLLDLVAEKVTVIEDVYDSAEVLEDYGVTIRYPDGWFEPTSENVKEAYLSATVIRDFVKSKISSTTSGST